MKSPTTSSFVGLLACLGVCALLSTPPVHGDQFSFRKIVDSSTPYPDTNAVFATGGRFSDVGLAHGNVAFSWGDGRDHSAVVLSLAGMLQVVADASTVVPGTSEHLTAVGWCSLGGNRVAFVGTAPSGRAVYLWSTDGTLTRVTPPGLVIGSDFPPLAFDDQTLYIQTTIYGSVLYSYDGSSLTKLISEKPDAAFCGTVNDMCLYSADAGAVIFVGGIDVDCKPPNDKGGIIVLRGSVPTVVVDFTAPVPGAPGSWWRWYSVALSGTNFAMVNYSDSLGAGIYASIGGQLGVIANSRTPIPGGTTNFAAFFDFVAIDGTSVAFNGYSAVGRGGTEGIYTTLGGSLRKVIDTNDTLEGRRIYNVQMSNRGFSGGEIAFVANFSEFGNQEGVYVARLVAEPVPAPRLTVAVNADSVTLSWPLEGQDYGLYETGDFPSRSPAQWTFLPYQKVVDGRITVTGPLGSVRAFYRLMKP